MYYFFALYNNNCKSFQMSTICSNHKCSKVIGISSDIFGNVGKSSENRLKCSEVAWTSISRGFAGVWGVGGGL